MLDHIGLTVRDLDRSLAFYCDTLGGRFLWRKDRLEGPQNDLVFGLPGCALRAAGVEVWGVSLELFQFERPTSAPGPVEYHLTGWKHVAMAVEDIDARVGELQQKGVRVRFPVQEVAPGVRIVYFEDPDGIIWEFIERSR
ncbi:MAG: VOC family protein [Bacillota bacterium]